MSVTIDSQRVEVDSLGYQTVGEVLGHIQRQDRLVVQLVVDGEEPDLGDLAALRSRPVRGSTLYIETAAPAEVASEVIEQVCGQLEQTEPLRAAAVEALAGSDYASALQRLAGCVSAWDSARRSVESLLDLLKLDADSVLVDGQSIRAHADHMATQLRDIRSALTQRDFVLLGDLLTYETASLTQTWVSALRRLSELLDRRASGSSSSE